VFRCAFPAHGVRPRGKNSEAMEHDAMSHSTTTVSGTTATLLLNLCAVGCGDASNTPEDGLRVEIDDSAGVTIVENDPAATDSRLPWQLGEQPSVSIGSVDSGEPDELFAVRDAMRLANGRIVVANLGSSELRVFNADGSHSGTGAGRVKGRVNSSAVRPPSHFGPVTRSPLRTRAGPGCRCSIRTATTAATWPSTPA